MKKITIITRQLKKFGGIERFVATLAKILSENFEVEIVANYGKASEETAFPFPKNVKITYLSPVEPEAISLKKIVSEKRFGKIPSEITRRKKINSEQKAAFRDFLGALKTDVIITERADYNFLVKSFYKGDAQKIATDHNFHQNNRKYINRLLSSIKGFDFLVVATKELRDFYQTQSTVDVVYIPNPLDSIPEEKSSLTTKNLISVGRFVPEKDFSTLIDTMSFINKKDPEIKLALIGDGPERKLLETKVRKNGLEGVVAFPGFLTQKEMKKYFLDSSLFVMTSKTEAFGLVLTEAMSYGLPCIAFDRASGAKAQINGKTGILISNANAQQMADEICRLLNDKKRLASYKSSLASELKKYSPGRVKADWLKLLG